MTDSLTDDQLAEIHRRADPEAVWPPTWGMTAGPLDYYRADVPLLLDEVERLKAELVSALTDAGMVKMGFTRVQETAEILADPEAMKQLKQSEQDIKAGRVIDQDEVERQCNA